MRPGRPTVQHYVTYIAGRMRVPLLREPAYIYTYTASCRKYVSRHEVCQALLSFAGDLWRSREYCSPLRSPCIIHIHHDNYLSVNCRLDFAHLILYTPILYYIRNLLSPCIHCVTILNLSVNHIHLTSSL